MSRMAKNLHTGLAGVENVRIYKLGKATLCRYSVICTIFAFLGVHSARTSPYQHP